ncbi:hypothetical protein BDZ85DRAFT_279450 [Elsinoe ampelina]|uniref:Uncharacterized protein n=1 Tax=Elsinoe ampelina TaxID=302913 RepID=A0A6A6GJY2_9PEZI|nr:hypothetical protein BDZ85DRAFT_279450 [Elsinoe ampelina]
MKTQTFSAVLLACLLSVAVAAPPKPPTTPPAQSEAGKSTGLPFKSPSPDGQQPTQPPPKGTLEGVDPTTGFSGKYTDIPTGGGKAVLAIRSICCRLQNAIRLTTSHDTLVLRRSKWVR